MQGELEPRNASTRRYSEQEKAAAVRMVRQLCMELGTFYGTVERVANELGYGIEPVRYWVRQAGIDECSAIVLSTEHSIQEKASGRDDREMRYTREIPKPAATFFAGSDSTASENAGDGSRGTVGGRARRDQIERAAVEVLAEVGYASASVGRIAKHAGVSKGVVTYHYSSKDDLLYRLVLSLFQERSTHIGINTSGTTTPAERLRVRISAELEFFSTRRIELLAMTEVVTNHREQSFGHACKDVYTSEIESLEDLLAEGQTSGYFWAFDVREAAHAISAAKNGLLDRLASDERFDLAFASARMISFFEGALSVR